MLCLPFNKEMRPSDDRNSDMPYEADEDVYDGEYTSQQSPIRSRHARRGGRIPGVNVTPYSRPTTVANDGSVLVQRILSLANEIERSVEHAILETEFDISTDSVHINSGGEYILSGNELYSKDGCDLTLEIDDTSTEYGVLPQSIANIYKATDQMLPREGRLIYKKFKISMPDVFCFALTRSVEDDTVLTVENMTEDLVTFHITKGCLKLMPSANIDILTLLPTFNGKIIGGKTNKLRLKASGNSSVTNVVVNEYLDVDVRECANVSLIITPTTIVKERFCVNTAQLTVEMRVLPDQVQSR